VSLTTTIAGVCEARSGRPAAAAGAPAMIAAATSAVVTAVQKPCVRHRRGSTLARRMASHIFRCSTTRKLRPQRRRDIHPQTDLPASALHPQTDLPASALHPEANTRHAAKGRQPSARRPDSPASVTAPASWSRRRRAPQCAESMLCQSAGSHRRARLSGVGIACSRVAESRAQNVARRICGIRRHAWRRQSRDWRGAGPIGRWGKRLAFAGARACLAARGLSARDACYSSPTGSPRGGTGEDWTIEVVVCP
jgi:hypothetical protein